MTSTIKPFCATYYNPCFNKSYSRLVCPPYDVISKEQLGFLRKKSPYNFSHILVADNNNYEKSGKTLGNWLKRKVLIDDNQESFYLHEQKFKVDGKCLKRFGILGLLRMDKKGIFPHEYTLRAPKEDREKIIKSTQTNLSPIFVIANKSLEVSRRIYELHCQKRPFLKFKDSEGVENRVWKIKDRKQIAKICKEIEKCKLVIADGHHRFETSFVYFKKNKARFKDLNYILAYIAGYQKGLIILPTHRVLDIKDREDIFFKKLEKYFTVRPIKQRALEKKIKDTSSFCMGLFRGGRFYFLQLKDLAILDKISNNKLYKQLDTYVFHKLVLPLFKISGPIEYTHSLREAKMLAAKGKSAFILRAPPLELVLKIASKGFRLPQKSTYFYPKLLSGIVMRRFQKK